ncbi:MAG: DUF721 domain-containing protein [Cytophagales bacterium]|nr:DUF721 domain-containing protein [Armatimonadota bacterium]
MRYGGPRGSGERRRAGIESVGKLVGERIGALDFEAKIREHTAPLVWAEVVGPQVAGATEVIGVREGVLRVSTKSSVWSSELTFYKNDILQRLNTRLGARAGSPAITDILFQNHGLKRQKEAREAAENAPPPLAPTPEELDDVALSAGALATVEEGVSAITDDLLRARLRRLRIADMKLRTWRLDSGWTPCPRCGDLAAPHLLGATDAAAPGTLLCPRCRVAR